MKNKTNAMRRLDAAKIPYEVCEYEVDENDLSGKHIADEIGLSQAQISRLEKGALEKMRKQL